MKKILAIILCAVICASLGSCVPDTYEEKPTKESSAIESETVEPKVETYGLNETAAFSNLKFTATEIKETTGDNVLGMAEAGKIYVGVKFTVENVSNEDQNVSTWMLFTAYADDIKCGYSFNAEFAFDDGTLDGTISPGKKLVGWYAVEIPEDWQTLELQVNSDWLSSSMSAATFVFEK